MQIKQQQNTNCFPYLDDLTLKLMSENKELKDRVLSLESDVAAMGRSFNDKVKEFESKMKLLIESKRSQD